MVKESFMTIAEISETYGVPARTLRDRIKRVKELDGTEYPAQKFNVKAVRYWVDDTFVNDIVRGARAYKHLCAANAAQKKIRKKELSVKLGEISVKSDTETKRVDVSFSCDAAAIRRFVEFLRSFK